MDASAQADYETADHLLAVLQAELSPTQFECVTRLYFVLEDGATASISDEYERTLDAVVAHFGAAAPLVRTVIDHVQAGGDQLAQCDGPRCSGVRP